MGRMIFSLFRFEMANKDDQVSKTQSSAYLINLLHMLNLLKIVQFWLVSILNLTFCIESTMAY